MSLIDKLDYLLVPNDPKTISDNLDLFNSIYDFWKKNWSETLKQIGGPELDKAQFLRQDWLAVLKLQNQIVGTHFYTVFDWDFELTRECDYFYQIESELNKYCQKNKVRTLLTQEYLCVAPDYRKSMSQTSIPEVLISLALKLMERTQLDATVGTVRAGAPSVERICKQIEAQLLDTTVFRYSQPHKFFIANKSVVKPLENHVLNSQVENLWKNRSDLSLSYDNDRVA